MSWNSCSSSFLPSLCICALNKNGRVREHVFIHGGSTEQLSAICEGQKEISRNSALVTKSLCELLVRCQDALTSLWAWGSFALYYSFKKQERDYTKGTWCCNDCIKTPFSSCNFFEMRGVQKIFTIWALHHNFLCSITHLHPVLHFHCTSYNIFTLLYRSSMFTLRIKPWVNWVDFVVM